MSNVSDASQRENHHLTPVRIERTTYSLGTGETSPAQSEIQSWGGLKRSTSPTTTPQQKHAGVASRKRNSLSATRQAIARAGAR